MFLRSLMASAITISPFVSASGFPESPKNTITKQIHGQPGLSITYKETFICETQARGWAGYVHLPHTLLSDVEVLDSYSISMFFWYFEARNSAREAQTAIYLAGGPGQSSMYGAVGGDGGPCTVLPDSNTTHHNEWSWNTDVNMLYVDSPVGTGYSYDTLINSTTDFIFPGEPLTETGITPIESYGGDIPASNATFQYGTFPSQNPNRTANSTALAARTLWHFAQVWLQEFPEYNTCDKRVSIWGNSYGGYSTTATAWYFASQNERIKEKRIPGHIIPIDTVGFTNGCVDMLYQAESYPQMAYNNTYDLEIIPKPVFEEASLNFTKPGGCRDLIQECRELGELSDPDQLSINSTVNDACLNAELYCATYVLGAFDAFTNRSDFDISHFKPDPVPAYYLIGFFNQAWVQEALGSPVNYTSNSMVVANKFIYVTGDDFRYPGMKNIEYLLGHGVKVAMQYGDRDYRCNWLGGQALSLGANWTGAENFRAAGYETMSTNKTYNGGMPNSFKPETSFQMFNRVMSGKDVATGRIAMSDKYATSGPQSSFGIKNKLPAAPETNCYLYNVLSTCAENQYMALANGTATIVDFTIVEPKPISA